MKRQKRDRLTRAHHQGYKAGIEGRSSDNCPYNRPDIRGSWLGGWREALEAKHSGLFIY